MTQQAQESSLGSGITTFATGDLGDAIAKISAAGENYRSAYSKLESYFENDLKNAVQGDTLNDFKSCFDSRKAALKAVNDYVDELLSTLRTKTNEGADLADNLSSTLKSHNG